MSLVVISYDIADDRRRNKVANTLLDYGKRVQYSVFEVDDTVVIDEIMDKLTILIDQNVDNIRYYRLCRGCTRRITVTGKDKTALDINTDYIII